MAKRLNISEDSDDSDKDVFTAKRPKLTAEAAQSSGSGSSSDPDSDAEWTMDTGSGKKVTSSAKKGGQKGGSGGSGAGGSGGGKGRKGAPRKVPSKKMASVPSSSDSSDDDDEDEQEMGDDGENSSSSEGSSSDSDSDSSRNSVKFDDGLDDQLMGDEEDQKMLSLMNEKEREAEMYNRYERREALKARFEIEQRLIRQKKSMKKKSKQDKVKRSLRDKRPQKPDKSAKSQAMDEYKAKRVADKIRKAEAEKQPEEKEPLKVSDVFSSESDSDDDSSFESADSDEKKKQSKPISTSSELAKIKLSRYRLEKWVHMPYFKDAVVGCFVRVGIGAHEGRMVYRICEVVNVQETQKVYNLGSTKTNKGLKLRHGIQERIFRMEYVSNSPFVETEFNKWVVEMEKRGLQLPTVDSVQKKVKELEKFRNTSLKEEDVEKIVKEKQRFRKNPRNYAMTKSRLIRERDMAEQEGDAEKAKTLADKLQELEERADQLDKQRTKGLSAISYINERNRQRNVVRAEMALKEELAATEGKEDDPFTRRKCQPTLVTLVREGSEVVNVSPSKSTPTKKPAEAEGSDIQTPSAPPRIGKEPEATPNASTLLATPVPPPATPQVNDLFSAHNFDIQIDLPSTDDGDSVTPKAIARPTVTPKQDGPKRSLNLADYKKRRGLI